MVLSQYLLVSPVDRVRGKRPLTSTPKRLTMHTSLARNRRHVRSKVAVRACAHPERAMTLRLDDKVGRKEGRSRCHVPFPSYENRSDRLVVPANGEISIPPAVCEKNRSIDVGRRTRVCLNTECQEDVGFFFWWVVSFSQTAAFEKKKNCLIHVATKRSTQGRLPRGSFPPSAFHYPSPAVFGTFRVSWEESVWRNTRTVSISDDFEGNPHALVLWPVVSSPQDHLVGISQQDRGAHFPFKKHPSKHDQSNHRREDQHEPLR